MWRTDPLRLKFTVSSVYDTLPSQSTLSIWKLTDNPACVRCGKRATLEPILGSCTKSLADGRYRWHYDHEIEAIVGGLNKACKSATMKKQILGFINFVKATKPGTKPKCRASNKGSSRLLGMASDWTLQVDLRETVKIPRRYSND